MIEFEWFNALLIAAKHQDRIRSWPWYGRWIHYLFVSWRCPACIYWKKRR